MEEKQLGSEPMFHTASKSHKQSSLIKHSRRKKKGESMTEIEVKGGGGANSNLPAGS